MFLKYIKSEIGSNILVHEGFMYHFEKKEYKRKYGDAYVLRINVEAAFMLLVISIIRKFQKKLTIIMSLISPKSKLKLL
jgi:hypothetical protein